MASVFTKIIKGELPGNFVWKDDHCVAFLPIRPLRPGHTLVVPRQEVDHWLDLEPALASHLVAAARDVGKGIHRAFPSRKIGFSIVGLEVPHVHIHLVPIDSMRDMDFAHQDPNATSPDLAIHAEKIRTALRSLGYPQVAG